MPDSTTQAQTFASLHKPGEPLILFNVWDAGSAQTVAGCGAKAIASGSHGVANAHGYEDGEQIPFDLALATTKRITEVVDLPVSMDIETGYGTTPEAVAATARQAMEAGAVGINFEDQLFGETTLRPVAEQVERIRAIRAAAEELDIPLYINARSDLFKNAAPEKHNRELLDEAIVRAKAYAEAGGSGFFLPGITDLELIRALCEAVPVPVNIIKIPGTPSTRELTEAGVARISYGPVPYLQMIEWLKSEATAALSA